MIGKKIMQIVFVRSLNLIFPHTCPSPPAQCEVSPHLKRVVFLLLRLWQRSAACDFSGVELDRWHAPHLRGTFWMEMSSLSLSTPLRQSEVVQGPGRDFDLGPRTFPGCSWCPLTNLLLPGYIFFAFARKLITWRDPKETTATVAPALVTWTWSWEVSIPFNLRELS